MNLEILVRGQIFMGCVRLFTPVFGSSAAEKLHFCQMVVLVERHSCSASSLLNVCTSSFTDRGAG